MPRNSTGKRAAAAAGSKGFLPAEHLKMLHYILLHDALTRWAAKKGPKPSNFCELNEHFQTTLQRDIPHVTKSTLERAIAKMRERHAEIIAAIVRDKIALDTELQQPLAAWPAAARIQLIEDEHAAVLSVWHDKIALYKAPAASPAPPLQPVQPQAEPQAQPLAQQHAASAACRRQAAPSPPSQPAAARSVQQHGHVLVQLRRLLGFSSSWPAEWTGLQHVRAILQELSKSGSLGDAVCSNKQASQALFKFIEPAFTLCDGANSDQELESCSSVRDLAIEAFKSLQPLL